jgi:hypothetical protein
MGSVHAWLRRAVVRSSLVAVQKVASASLLKKILA